jgi:hypothetical protein
VASGSILCSVNKKVELLIKLDLGLRPSIRNLENPEMQLNSSPFLPG